MNPQQKSVSLALLVIAAALAIKHSWFGTAIAWAKRPTTQPSATVGKATTGLADWEAMLLLYLAAMVVSDTQLSPVAPPVMWAVAFVSGARAVGQLQQSGAAGLFGAPGQAQGSGQSQGAQGGPGGNPGAAEGGQSF